MDLATSAVAGLDETGLYIDPAVESVVDRELLEQAQAETGALDYDVYVLVVPEESADADLLTLVEALTDKEGLYIVVSDGSSLATKIVLEDRHETTMEIYDQLAVLREKSDYQDPGVTKLNDLIDLLNDPQAAPADSGSGQAGVVSPDREPELDYSSDGVSVATIVLALLLVIAGVALVRGRRARSRSRRSDFTLPKAMINRVEHLQRESVRKELSDDTLDLANRLRELRLETLDEDSARRVERGLDAYAMASRIVDEPKSSRVDLAGALVLLRQAGHELAVVAARTGDDQKGSGRRRRGPGRKAGVEPVPQSLCVINPLHGEAPGTAEVTVAEGRAESLPVCQDCRSTLVSNERSRSPREPKWLYDGDKPYVEGDSVWARTLFGAIGPDLVTQLQRQPPRR